MPSSEIEPALIVRHCYGLASDAVRRAVSGDSSASQSEDAIDSGAVVKIVVLMQIALEHVPEFREFNDRPHDRLTLGIARFDLFIGGGCQGTDGIRSRS